MRTTIDINDDLMHTIKQKSLQTGLSLKVIINQALNLGIKKIFSNSGPKYKLPVYSLGNPVNYNLDKSLELAASLENDEIIRKMQLKK